MSEYQVLARRYRPQKFQDVVGQEAIIITLKNAIKFNRLAHAYLFCGARGTGKTTIARLFAKALNCQKPNPDLEPCNCCPSCREITSGSSLDVLEIDGASHRGIDDVRQINETVTYATASGKYKIYIIDEVHMLTKEAFNALLKTLEEPPPLVKFFFATTEPHKVLPTILSRCQRFNLNRISIEKIISKLRQITQDLNIRADEEALRLIANRSDGGLRDAESLLDQIISFHQEAISSQIVADVLGIMPKEILFELDHAGKQGNYGIAFEIADRLFSQGKDLIHFVETMIEHFRNILLIKLSDKSTALVSLTDAEREKYASSSLLYSQEQCLTILDDLVAAQNQIRFATSGKMALEALLLRILRSHHRLPVEFLVRRLSELEQLVNHPSTAEKQMVVAETITPSTSNSKPREEILSSVSEDPTPTLADLGIKEKIKPVSPPPATVATTPSSPPTDISKTKQSRYDTLLQFAAVELEGSIKKNQ